MKTYYTTDFTGFYPIGACAITAASSEKQARVKLRRAIINVGLPKPKRGFKIDYLSRGAIVALDGNY